MEMAERVGFEPTVEFPLHTLSKRAPSTTRTSLRSSGISSLPRSMEPAQTDCDVRCDACNAHSALAICFGVRICRTWHPVGNGHRRHRLHAADALLRVSWQAVLRGTAGSRESRSFPLSWMSGGG